MDAVETEAVAAIRRFNRFHTRWVGALGGSLHGSGLVLAEARVLYELAQRDDWQAGEMARALDLDPAYLSRILKRFSGLGWLDRSRSAADGRAWRLRLTAQGRAAFQPLDQASSAQAGAILERLAPAEQARLSRRSPIPSVFSGEAGIVRFPSFASIALATWAGSSAPMAGSMPRIMAGT